MASGVLARGHIGAIGCYVLYSLCILYLAVVSVTLFTFVSFFYPSFHSQVHNLNFS